MYPVIILHVISQDNMIKGNSRMFLETRMIHGIRCLCIYINNVSGIRPNAVVEFLDANSVLIFLFKNIFFWLTNNFEANYKYVTKSSALMVIVTTNERVMVFKGNEK